MVKDANIVGYVIAGIIGIALGATFMGYEVAKKVCQKCKADPHYDVCTDLQIDTTKCK